MDAQPLAVAFAGAATRHARPVLGPEIDALGARIACDHALVIVARLMGQGLDAHEVAGLDFELRFEVPAEVAPMNRVGIGRQMMMPGRRRDSFWQRETAGRQCRRTAPGREATGEEGAALACHVLDELAMMQLELAAARIVTPAHELLRTVSVWLKGRSRPWRRAPGR
jgi:hypothetical protein